MKTAVLTFNRALNHGAVLQAYALQRTITELLHDDDECFLLDYKCTEIENAYKAPVLHKGNNIFDFIQDIFFMIYRTIILGVKRKKYNEFINSCMKIFPLPDNDLRAADNYFDIFITGSDQVWNNDLTGNDDNYFLKFVSAGKKFSYAASFGKEEIFSKHRGQILENLSDFDVISLREPIGEGILKDNGHKLRVDLDPTLLLDSQKWGQLINCKKNHKEYILIYYAHLSNDLMQKAIELSKKTGLKIICLSDSLKDKLRYPCMSIKRGRGPGDFLSLVRNSRYVITNSFHGTAFSILFHKDFYVELNNDNGFNYRVHNILKELDLMECSDFSGLRNNNLFSAEKWNEVDSLLDLHRKNSLEYLNSIILNGKDK